MSAHSAAFSGGPGIAYGSDCDNVFDWVGAVAMATELFSRLPDQATPGRAVSTTLLKNSQCGEIGEHSFCHTAPQQGLARPTIHYLGVTEVTLVPLT